MPSGFDSDDLNSFFDPDGVGVAAVITDGGSFSRVLNGAFTDNSLAVGVYPELNIEAPDPSFECKTGDLVGVKTKTMTVTFPGLSSDEDGYGKTYRLERIANAGVQTSKVYLKEI